MNQVATVGSQHSEPKTLLEHAAEMKERQRGGVSPDANTFAVLMDAYGIERSLKKMKGCLDEMERRDLEPSIGHFHFIIRAYAACARETDDKDAEAQFQELLQRCLAPTEATFGALIDMYAQNGQPKKAEEKLEQKTLHFRYPLNKKDCSMMVNAHANAAQDGSAHVHKAVKWHNKIRTLFPDDLDLYDYTVIIKACARARPKRLDLACEVFRQLHADGMQPDHFNIVTLQSVAGKNKVQGLMEEFGVDTKRLEEEFQAFGDEHNFDGQRLNRKMWKFREVEDFEDVEEFEE